MVRRLKIQNIKLAFYKRNFKTIVNSRDRQWTDLQGGPGGGKLRGGLAGQRITLHRKKIPFLNHSDHVE